jgi:hypothetical protein
LRKDVVAWFRRHGAKVSFLGSIDDEATVVEQFPPPGERLLSGVEIAQIAMDMPDDVQAKRVEQLGHVKSREMRTFLTNVLWKDGVIGSLAQRVLLAAYDLARARGTGNRSKIDAARKAYDALADEYEKAAQGRDDAVAQAKRAKWYDEKSTLEIFGRGLVDLVSGVADAFVQAFSLARLHVPWTSLLPDSTARSGGFALGYVPAEIAAGVTGAELVGALRDLRSRIAVARAGVGEGNTLVPESQSVLSRTPLRTRVSEVHGMLDPIAQQRRTTAILETAEGPRVVGQGGRDLSLAHEAALQSGEIPAWAPGVHAERTVLSAAATRGLTPIELATSRTICPECTAAIEAAGGKVAGQTRALFPPQH